MDSAFTLVGEDAAGEQPSVQDFKAELENGTDESKADTMRRILVVMLNGSPLPQLLMHIIRFVMPSKSKALKKLLHFYIEICPKVNPDGRLKQEMILICNALRNDLQHPNEYVRGITLRFLSKLKEPELLEPLLPSCRACLEHRHAYVRKNAVLAIYSIFSHSPQLVPDAAEITLAFLSAEGDATCRRNAFVALGSINTDMAREYLQQNIDTVMAMDELMQLAVIEYLRKDAFASAQNKPRYLQLIFDLLDTPNNTVVYEAAISLTLLTNNATAITEAVKRLIDIIAKESDNNVKLIILNRVNELRTSHAGIIDNLLLDLLRVLNSPDIDVRRQALFIALEIVTSKDIEEFVSLLKLELSKTMNENFEKDSLYMQLLIQTVHTCAIRFPQVAAAVVDLLMEFAGDFNKDSAVDVITFVKEVIDMYPDLRSVILEKLFSMMTEVRNGKVYRGAIWILGEYCDTESRIQDAWKVIRSSIGELPLLSTEQKLTEKDGSTSILSDGPTAHEKRSAGPKVLPDGTYATESALVNDATLKIDRNAQKPPLRALILDGDFYLSSALASTLTKLVMRHAQLSSDKERTNALRAEAMLTMISIIRIGKSQLVKTQIDEDSVDRIMSCVRSLAKEGTENSLQNVFLLKTRQAFHEMVLAEGKKRAENDALLKEKNAVQVDDVISIRQLSKQTDVDRLKDFDLDLSKAIGLDAIQDDTISKLKRVVQLTGFSDPVYAEAYVKVFQFDITLEVLLVNQTSETLQNLTVEFATLGDLKVIEKPAVQNLAAHSFLTINSTIKVSSTDTGVIFGNIVYDGSASTDTSIVTLNDIHVDIMDYIRPSECSETQFRSMWTEFEWENKVNISTNASSLRVFLDYLLKNTNMTCLTPESSLKGDCRFLSANLYAQSIFGEDALANLSAELEGEGDTGKIIGHVRIRSKQQGLALCLGDRIAGLQKAGVSTSGSRE